MQCNSRCRSRHAFRSSATPPSSHSHPYIHIGNNTISRPTFSNPLQNDFLVLRWMRFPDDNEQIATWQRWRRRRRRCGSLLSWRTTARFCHLLMFHNANDTKIQPNRAGPTSQPAAQRASDSRCRQTPPLVSWQETATTRVVAPPDANAAFWSTTVLFDSWNFRNNPFLVSWSKL
jgi:hypothetical protein